MAIEVHIFKNKKDAKRFADKKNARAKKYRWEVRSRPSGGYGAYKFKRFLWPKK